MTTLPSPKSLIGNSAFVSTHNFVETREIPTYEIAYPIQSKQFVTATCVQEVQQAVKEASDAGLRIRPMGAGQSWVPHLLTSDVCLVTTGMDRIHNIDLKTKTFTVDAGATLGDVTRALGVHGLTLPSISFMPEATIGGIIATATHGPTPKWGTMSDSVLSLDLVLASGELKHLGPNSPPDELRAARASVGMLGVVTRVEMQAIDIPWVCYRRFDMSLDDYLVQWPAIHAKYPHMWVHWILGDDTIQIDCLEASSVRHKGFYSYVDDRERCWNELSIPARWLNTRSRRAARKVLKELRALKEKLSPAKAPATAATEIRNSMQYAVPLGDMHRVISAIRNSGVAAQFAGRDMEIKFLQKSDLSLLGPNADGESALFNVFWMVPETEKYTFLDPFENLMRSMNAKPHWGKFHQRPDVDYMRRAYDTWDRFETVRQRFDPKGMFSMFEPTNGHDGATGQNSLPPGGGAASH